MLEACIVIGILLLVDAVILLLLPETKGTALAESLSVRERQTGEHPGCDKGFDMNKSSEAGLTMELGKDQLGGEDAEELKINHKVDYGSTGAHPSRGSVGIETPPDRDGGGGFHNPGYNEVGDPVQPTNGNAGDPVNLYRHSLFTPLDATRGSVGPSDI